MQMSQEMPNLRHFLALVLSGDNRMTIILWNTSLRIMFELNINILVIKINLFEIGLNDK